MDHLHLPLLNPATTPTAATATAATTADATTARAVFIRVVLVVIVAVISSWASMEASKGFEVIILNQVRTTAAGRRFHLLFQSDDEAERIVLQASASVERLLFPNQLYPRRPIRRVTLRLVTSSNNTNYLITHHFSDEVTLEVSSKTMEEDDVRATMKAVVLRGMARAWLWDGQGQAPEQLVDGMADCVTVMAGTRSVTSGHYSGYSLSSAEAAARPEDDCWEGEEEGRVAGFFLYCEELRPGFLARLNGGMEHRWHGWQAVDFALGLPAREACVAYRRRLVMARGGQVRWEGGEGGETRSYVHVSM